MDSSPWISNVGHSREPSLLSLRQLSVCDPSEQLADPRLLTSTKKYPAKEHARKVATALGQTTGAIFLPGRPSKHFQDSDMGPEFRQWRYFYYLTGVDEPDCNVIYDIAVDHLILYVPDTKSFHDIVWSGAGLTREEALDGYDIDAVDYYSSLGGLLRLYLESKKGPLFILHPDDLKPFSISTNDLIDQTHLMPAMNSCRVIKDEYEIAAIREANRISAIAHTDVLRSIASLDNETSVEAIFKGVSIDHGAKHQAYNPIAASGKNAATLHYMKNDEPLKGRQLMCLDAGCEWKNYACDVTRTFPLSKSWPSKEAKEIYDIVEQMQEACISQMRPGVLYRDLNVLAHHIVADGLLKLGILHNGTVDEIVKAGTSLAFFPHGLGHHVGLEVHDVAPPDDPLYANTVYRPFGLTADSQRQFADGPDSKRPFVNGAIFDRYAERAYFQEHYSHLIDPRTCHAPVDLQSGALRPGMVVTVEPGIYFNDFSLEHLYLPSPVHSKYINQTVLKRYMPVGGVRIEDDILVHGAHDKPENLTTAPKGDDMLKVIRGELDQKDALLPASTRNKYRVLRLAKKAIEPFVCDELGI